MKITAITGQKGRQNRVSIFIDGTYRFSLSHNQLTDLGLRANDDLSEDQFNMLLQQAELGKALDKAYRFLSYRSRSRQEVAGYLHRQKYDDSIINEVILKLEDQKLLNDSEFAAEWIANRQLLNPRSPVELKAELRQKGISAGIIEDAIAALNTSSERETLKSLMAKKNLRRRYPDQRKLKNYLAGKGYSADVIRSVLEDEPD